MGKATEKIFGGLCGVPLCLVCWHQIPCSTSVTVDLSAARGLPPAGDSEMPSAIKSFIFKHVSEFVHGERYLHVNSQNPLQSQTDAAEGHVLTSH